MRIRLRAFRQRHALTITDFAARLGYTRQWVSLVESGSGKVGPAFCAALAREFKVSFERAAEICELEQR